MKKSGLADSPFFTAPQESNKVPELRENEKQPQSERNSERTIFRSEERRVTPARRRTKRYSFEFYEDQIYALKRLKYLSELRNENVKLSDMARDAFDQYLKDKANE